MKRFYELGKNTLFLICRSLRVDVFRKSLKIIKLGTKVFDWNIAEVWNIFDFYFLNKNNTKIINFNTI